MRTSCQSTDEGFSLPGVLKQSMGRFLSFSSIPFAGSGMGAFGTFFQSV